MEIKNIAKYSSRLVSINWIKISFKLRFFVKKAIARYEGVFMLLFKENKCFSA